MVFFRRFHATDSGKGVSNKVSFTLDVSHFHIVFSLFQEESLVGFCRLCSKNEQIMLVAVLKVFGNYARIVLFSLNYGVLVFELCCLVFKPSKG